MLCLTACLLLRSTFFSSPVAQKIGLLRKSFRMSRDQNALLRSFNSFIHLCLEYCAPVWFTAVDSHHKLLDNLWACIIFFISNLTYNFQHWHSISLLYMLYKIFFVIFIILSLLNFPPSSILG